MEIYLLMRIIKFKFLSIISVLLFVGCANKSTVNTKAVTINYAEPKWMSNPYIDLPKGTIVAVGCARRHFKGRSAQKKLAISRAIDEIATEVKTTVNNVTLRRKNNSASSMNTTSMQSVDNVKLKTEVISTYMDENGNMCVRVKRINF